jgi:hypothetical protein
MIKKKSSSSEKRKEQGKPKYQPRTKEKKMNPPKIHAAGTPKDIHDLPLINPNKP